MWICKSAPPPLPRSVGARESRERLRKGRCICDIQIEGVSTEDKVLSEGALGQSNLSVRGAVFAYDKLLSIVR